MEIKDILNQLGIDLSNPEAKRGALEAIDAILSSRAPAIGGGGGGGLGGSGGEQEVELDPDLLQPSIKQAAEIGDDDIEIEDEENILDQIKHNDSEEPIENKNSNGSDSSDSDGEPTDSESTDSSDPESSGDSAEGKSNAADHEATDTEDDELKDSTEDEDPESTSKVASDDDESTEADADEQDSEDSELDTDASADDHDEDSDGTFDSDEEEDNFADEEGSDDDFEGKEDDDEEDEEEPDFDENDFLDDELKDSTEDEAISKKHDARKIKRERTIAAAQKALVDAKAKKVAPALIRELESAIAALEALTEAVKSIKDISDAEFNQMVNRVFDAIDAIGGSDLTYTSDEERETRATEIKNDLASAQTQAELSAEDVAKIRAETQAIKAREKEVAKYAGPGRGSFKGFQEFLNSLYRAIALQVHTEETRDDSWSALSRRNSGDGVLRQGQKVQELQNKKIPVIDFYFDCSASWTQADIDIGKKAVSALADMEQNGQIKVNIYYFSDGVSQNYEDVADGSTSAWNLIIKNIIATQANNVIIMTDSDMEGQGRHKGGTSDFLKYTVPGYVWYLWKDGVNAPRLPRDLKGRGGVQQFAFNTSEV